MQPELWYIIDLQDDFFEGVVVECTEADLAKHVAEAMDQQLSADPDTVLVFRAKDGRKVVNEVRLVSQ